MGTDLLYIHTYIYTYIHTYTYTYISISAYLSIYISYLINIAIIIKKWHLGPGIGMSPQTHQSVNRDLVHDKGDIWNQWEKDRLYAIPGPGI